MASLVTKIYKVLGAEPRCRPGCARTRTKAIEEQVAKQLACPLEHCKFKKEIENAILLSKTPELIQFFSNKSRVLDSDTIVLTWELLNVKNCSLMGYGEISNSGSKEIQLKETSNLVLEFEAFNGEIYNSEPLGIEVLPAPDLVSFSISHSELIRGNSSKISWESKNIIKAALFINDIESSLKATDTIEIIPEFDTSIKLILIGHLKKEITSTKNIRVFEPVNIKSFTTNKSKVLDNEVVSLNYEIENASQVLLTGDSLVNKIDISSSNTYQLSPHITTNTWVTQTYHIEVYDKLKKLSQQDSISIEVYPSPLLVNFISTKEKILYGEEIELKWEVKNYSKIQLQINDKLLDVSTKNSYKHKPSKQSEYRLIIDSLEKIAIIESTIQKVDVLHEVEIDFKPDKLLTIQSVPVTLNWSVYNATNIFLNSPNNTIPPFGSTSVNPDETTTYTIVASNELSEKTLEFTIKVFPTPNIENIKLPNLPQFTPNFTLNNSTHQTKNIIETYEVKKKKGIVLEKLIKKYPSLTNIILNSIKGSKILKKINQYI